MAAKIAKFHGFTSQPRFQHDCKCCKFLGTIDESDMYVCVSRERRESTYILRDGSDGPDYRSLPTHLTYLHPVGSEYRLVEKLDKLKRRPAMYYTY